MRLHLSSLAIFTTSIASAALLRSDRLGVQRNPTGALDGSVDRQLGMARMKKSVQELVNGGPVAPEVAKTLQEVLENSLKVAVLSAKTALQKEVSEHYASGYDGCDAALASEQGASGSIQTNRGTFELGRSKHETCRKAEAASKTAFDTCATEMARLKSAKETACKAVDELNALTHGNCVRENGESYTKFAERLMNFYKLEAEKSRAAEEECETASSAHASQVESCTSLESKWTARKQECDAAQDIMDAAACAILDASQKVCKDYAKCNVQATTSYQVDLASVKSQEHGLKQEWKSLLLMQCQLKVFTTGSAGKQAALSTCVTADYTAAADSTIKLQYPSPVPRQAKPCTDAEGAAGRVAYEELHYQSLPGNAPAKTCTAECCAKCIEVTCPAGFQHKANAHALPGKLQEECCEKPFDGSTLLNTEAKKALLLGWLNNTLNWHLCFRKSTMSDGPRPQEFHQFCDDKGPTVFIAQLTTFIMERD